MSIVVIGGHDSMKKQYQEEGAKHGCKVKVFTQMTNNMEKEIGTPHLIILFTDVVSHKMVKIAVNVSKKKGIPSLRLHNSSLNSIKFALREIAVQKGKKEFFFWQKKLDQKNKLITRDNYNCYQ